MNWNDPTADPAAFIQEAKAAVRSQGGFTPAVQPRTIMDNIAWDSRRGYDLLDQYAHALSQRTDLDSPDFPIPGLLGGIRQSADQYRALWKLGVHYPAQFMSRYDTPEAALDAARHYYQTGTRPAPAPAAYTRSDADTRHLATIAAALNIPLAVTDLHIGAGEGVHFIDGGIIHLDDVDLTGDLDMLPPSPFADFLKGLSAPRGTDTPDFYWWEVHPARCNPTRPQKPADRKRKARKAAAKARKRNR